MVPMGPLPQPLGLTTRRQQLQQLTKTIMPQPGVRAPDLPAELRLSRPRPTGRARRDAAAVATGR